MPTVWISLHHVKPQKTTTTTDNDVAAPVAARCFLHLMGNANENPARDLFSIYIILINWLCISHFN
jgi:hypothetical protein